eukprot:s83_g19.t1
MYIAHSLRSRITILHPSANAKKPEILSPPTRSPAKKAAQAAQAVAGSTGPRFPDSDVASQLDIAEEAAAQFSSAEEAVEWTLKRTTQMAKEKWTTRHGTQALDSFAKKLRAPEPAVPRLKAVSPEVEAAAAAAGRALRELAGKHALGSKSQGYEGDRGLLIQLLELLGQDGGTLCGLRWASLRSLPKKLQAVAPQLKVLWPGWLRMAIDAAGRHRWPKQSCTYQSSEAELEMPETEEKPKREPREEITRHAMIICDQRPPGGHKEAQKKMDFYEQVVGSDKKK